MRFLLPLLCSLAVALAPLCGQQTVWVKDSSHFDRGVPETLNFEEENRTYFEDFDADGLPLIITTQRRNDQGVWEPWRRRELSYDDGLMTQLGIQFWNQATQGWENAVGRTFEYNAQGDLVRRTYQRAMGTGSPLENDKRWTYSYNNQGDQAMVIYEEWMGNSWLDAFRQSWLYDGQDRLVEQLGQVWTGSEWVNSRRRSWEYDANSGALRTIINQIWSDGIQDWVNVFRRDYLSTGPAWTNIRTQLWNENLGDWENFERELLDYSATFQLNFRTLERWENDEWVPLYRGGYEFDGETMNSLWDKWDESAGEWNLSRRYQKVYDEGGREVLSLGWQTWDEGAGIWENDTTTVRFTHFWSEQTISSTAEAPVRIDCRIPNPHTPGIPFFCEQLEAGQTYQLVLSDLLGRPVSSQQVSGGAEWTLPINASAGMYVLSIREGHHLRFAQKIVLIP